MIEGQTTELPSATNEERSAVRSGAWLGAVQATTPLRSHEKLGLVGAGGVLKHKPKALDLFCCEGGAGMGYALAGCDVTGVDIEAQPKYPFAFVLGDALEYLAAHGHEYDLIHASPPCQGYSHLTPEKNRADHAKLIPAVREMLVRLGKPYVIENVAGARRELLNPVMLCGSMFGLRTQRHRFFETNFPVSAPCKCDHSTLPLLVTTASKASRAKRHALGMKPKSVRNAPLAYGIGWMSCEGLKEAIPPAFTRFICERLLSLGGGGAELVGDEQRETNEGEAPNDPKLSHGGGWRGLCRSAERWRRSAAQAVTAVAVGCSAWLGALLIGPCASVTLCSFDYGFDWLPVRVPNRDAAECLVNRSQHSIRRGLLCPVVEQKESRRVKRLLVQCDEVEHVEETLAAKGSFLGSAAVCGKHVHDAQMQDELADVGSNVERFVSFGFLWLRVNMCKRTNLRPLSNMPKEMTERIIHV